MADQFQAGSCSSGSWWRAASTSGPAMSASASTELTNIKGGSFDWAAAANMLEAKSRSCDESPVSISNSSITFQDIQNPHVSAPMITAPMLEMDFGLSSPTIEWSQPFFSGRAENSFHALLQEDVIARPYAQRDSGIESNQIHLGIENSSLSPSKNMNLSFLQDHHVLSSSVNSMPLLSASSGLPSTLLHGLIEPDSRLQMSFYDAQPTKFRSSIDYNEASNQSLQTSLANLPQFMKASPPKQPLQFSNDTPFWNPSASSVTEAHSSLHHGRPPQLVQNENSSYSNLTVETTSGAGRSCSTMEKRSSCEPALKKPRVETPSPLPTFKVRKEKLGDRITALQQLVSPFGKTDTASVLHEAIEYIKFLHDQVRVLSSPYVKNGNQMQQTKNLDKSKDCEGQDQELRSRGLCLVPISSTFAVANEIPTDLWTPTFTGTFR